MRGSSFKMALTFRKVNNTIGDQACGRARSVTKIHRDTHAHITFVSSCKQNSTLNSPQSAYCKACFLDHAGVKSTSLRR